MHYLKLWIYYRVGGDQEILTILKYDKNVRPIATLKYNDIMDLYTTCTL